MLMLRVLALCKLPITMILCNQLIHMTCGRWKFQSKTIIHGNLLFPMYYIFLSVDRLWPVTWWSNFLVCRQISVNSRVALISILNFAVQILGVSVIAFMVLSKTRSARSQLTVLDYQWLVFHLSRHLRTAIFFGLPFVHSWLVLPVVDVTTCRRKWADISLEMALH
jgi:hypothetical protein